jgi:hypothetical protein
MIKIYSKTVLKYTQPKIIIFKLFLWRRMLMSAVLKCESAIAEECPKAASTRLSGFPKAYENFMKKFANNCQVLQLLETP